MEAPGHASHDAISYLINHIFLPPELPQQDDSTHDREAFLVSTVIESLENFVHNGIPDSVKGAIANLRDVLASQDVSEKALLRALGQLVEQGHAIPLHIRAQNAGILISRVGRFVNFEIFELSPLNEAVYSTQGRLRRSFPGSAVSIGLPAFQHAGFQDSIAHTLATMAHQPVKGMQPQAWKAGKFHDEDRDTTSPAMVSEQFFGFLAGIGSPADVSVISKNTREEVLWKDARSPWRRSSMWLLIRVTLQLSLQRLDSGSQDTYKQFMIHLMSNVLDLSLQAGIRTDVLYAMNAKVARRLQKLGSFSQGVVALPVATHVEQVMRKAKRFIEKQWARLQSDDSRALIPTELSSLSFHKDTLLDLPALDGYINAIGARQNSSSSCNFEPGSNPTLFPDRKLPDFIGSNGATEFAIQNLEAFESWVALNLRKWLQAYKDDLDACGRLGKLIQSYYSFASQQYSGNPEATSAMLLTVYELSMACDESAVHLYPLLGQYEPGVPSGPLQSLLLPFKDQMKRLRVVEDYLTRRKAHLPSSYVFHTSHGANSFAVRYFDKSAKHQKLLQDVEARATKRRQEKVAELERMKAEYSRLMQMHRETDCEFADVVVDRLHDITESRHKGSCITCSYKSQADAMTIEIHEWPLPDRSIEAKGVVFELAPPAAFACWRDTTVYLVVDILKGQYSTEERPRAQYLLRTDRQLSTSFNAPAMPLPQRIEFLSQDKPHLGTHRNRPTVSTATEKSVCLSSGLKYQYYDTSLQQFLGSFEQAKDDVLHHCTYTLPDRARPLQKFIFRPAAAANGSKAMIGKANQVQTPNAVIASQSECPDHMTPNEFRKLAAPPLGFSIQWLNLLVQLEGPIRRLPSIRDNARGTTINLSGWATWR